MIVPILFFLFLFGAAFAGVLPYAVGMVYLCASALTFTVYAFDKAAARRRQPRTSERTLHLLSLGCGWPGALLAQKALRHKSVKQPFQRIFRVTVAFNFCAVFLFVFPQLSLRALTAWNG